LETAQILDSYLSILARGGKRLRGALGMWSYNLAGGDDKGLAIHIARALEMVHAYLLVVDDVADQAQTRRGGLSAHILLEKYHADQNWFGDARHFGQMQAINGALAVQHLVMQEITELAAVDSTKLEAVRELSAVLFKTVIGQVTDVNHQAMRNVSEQDVLAMMQQKTAYYSFVSPLQFGVILSGKDWSEYEWLEQWAVNIGLSFQIMDDYLGVFGDEKTTGKSNLDDVREGKMTMLIVRALAHANEQQKAIIFELLGRQSLTEAELEHIQTIFEDTGAREYSLGLSRDYAEKAIVSLERAPAEYKDQVNFLSELSRDLLGRQS
jgi:geranylgeranyl pyrophosphate synthase